MPELPEVETMKRDLQRRVAGLGIDEVKVFDARVLKDLSARRFANFVRGRTIEQVRRRGKALIFDLDNATYLFVQVKMTGFFVYGPNLKQDGASKETKVVFQLANGDYLNYNDQRLFGWLYCVKDLASIPYMNTIGPEPLERDFKVDWLAEQLKKKVSPIKPLLMNQHFIAGIGNIYASEILFTAGIHPERRAHTITKKQIKLLHQATIDILNESIRQRGTSMRNYRDSDGEKGNFMNCIRVYGRDQQPCPECGQNIDRIVQAQRSTFFCNKCQT